MFPSSSNAVSYINPNVDKLLTKEQVLAMSKTMSKFYKKSKTDIQPLIEHGSEYSSVDSLPFGTLLGIARGGVPVYSSKGASFKNHYNGNIYYGTCFQCVEFARRWLVHTQGLTFSNVGIAYEIFNLTYATRISDNSKVFWNNILNGSITRPVPGCILVWNKEAEFNQIGHVAVVTAVSDFYVRIAEQNLDNVSWEGRDYSRELPAVLDNTSGAFHVYDHYRKGGTIKGWKLLPADFKPQPIPIPIHQYEPSYSIEETQDSILILKNKNMKKQNHKQKGQKKGHQYQQEQEQANYIGDKDDLKNLDFLFREATGYELGDNKNDIDTEGSGSDNMDMYTEEKQEKQEKQEK